MMINKRLIGTVGESKKYIAGNVALQWCSLAANMVLMTGIASLLAALFSRKVDSRQLAITGAVAVLCFGVRFSCTLGVSRMGYLSSKAVKKTLREKIFFKLLELGTTYQENVKTSEVIQVAVEGVDQLEIYFGAYLPQFFYAMLAPLTLFLYLSFVNFPSAVVLLVCVPLIPVAIAAVQTWAKKLLSKYWGQYTALGDTFLENLQGLTTLKIYQADAFKHKEMNAEAEKFRKITMKVLTMQLNSITIMDFIAYGGAALGIILAATQYRVGNVSLTGCLLIILLAADFFLPMRQLGSFFHIAMNGMAASDKIFRLLDLAVPEKNSLACPHGDIVCEKLSYSYEPEREIDESSLMREMTYIGHQSYLFKGTVRDNLQMGRPDTDDAALWAALEQVRLADFLRSAQGLDTRLTEKGGNLSGGQCQRLALARALLHDSPVYIFDEATSNIDMESENDIMERIHTLAKEKTVILISHRLANVTAADQIYVMEQGRVLESGSHEALLNNHGVYEKLWNAQQALENFGKDGDAQ